MIKLAYNKANSNLVFKIDAVIRTSMAGGIVEYYEGTLVDTSTVPDTETPNYRVQVMGFESDWLLVPTDIGGTSGVNNQAKTVDPSTSEQTIVADTGYTGLSSVTVNAVTADVDSNIVAENIKKDVTILGVTGTAATLEFYPISLHLNRVVSTDTKDTYEFTIEPNTSATTYLNTITLRPANGGSVQRPLEDEVITVHAPVDTYEAPVTISVDFVKQSMAEMIDGYYIVGYTTYIPPIVIPYPDKTVGDITFANASVAWDGNESNFNVTVHNNGGAEFTSNIQVDFLDAENNVIGTCQGLVIGVAAGGNQQMTCSHYINLTEAVDVSYSFFD